jgi:hypothetical protein
VSQWFNYEAALKILIFGLLMGAGLPALFAVAVRLNAVGAGVAGSDGTLAQKNPVLGAVSWVIFGIVLVAVLIGVLFIARDFIGHQTGLYLLGAKPK